MEVFLGAVVGMAVEAIGSAVAAVVRAWRQVTLQALSSASPRRAVAALLHLFVAIPLVLGSIWLGKLVGQGLSDDFLFFMALLVLLPVAVFVLVGAALLIAGSLMGAAGALTGDAGDRAAGVTSAAVGLVLALTLLGMGETAFAWPLASLCMLALGADALLWAAPDD
ncbi:MAG: hypothetical protein ACLGHT_11415 [Acidimicrobiia bacterium]